MTTRKKTGGGRHVWYKVTKIKLGQFYKTMIQKLEIQILKEFKKKIHQLNNLKEDAKEVFTKTMELSAYPWKY